MNLKSERARQSKLTLKSIDAGDKVCQPDIRKLDAALGSLLDARFVLIPLTR